MILTVTLNTALDKTLEVPGFQVGAHLPAEVRSFIPAGKGINVARGIKKMDLDAKASGFVGEDQYPIYENFLSSEGVGVELVGVDGTTRTNTTILDPRAGTITHLRESGFQVTQKDLNRFKSLLADLFEKKEFKHVVFCGSLPPGIGPDVFRGLQDFCKKRGARVLVDTSGSALSATYKSASADAIKPNLEELSTCLAEDVDMENVLRKVRPMLERFEYVLVTAGKGGAYYVGQEEEFGFRCEVADFEIKNTVGCGDAFLAGWLAGVETGKGPRKALKMGTAAGTASACGENACDYMGQDVNGLLDRCEAIGFF